MDELLKKIPPDVVKFFFLEKSAQTHLNFDLDLARERSEKNPVYYVSMNYQVQRITRYAIELASLFHQFYQNCQVLSEDKDLKRARLALILATKEVIKITLDLMGISAPTKM